MIVNLNGKFSRCGVLYDTIGGYLSVRFLPISARYLFKSFRTSFLSTPEVALQIIGAV